MLIIYQLTLLINFNSNSKALINAMNQRVASSLVDTAIKNALQAVATGELTPYQAMQTVQDAQERTLI